MNLVYDERKQLAYSIASKLRTSVIGTILVGSVAYCPEKVREETDVDLVNVIDLNSFDAAHARADLELKNDIFFPLSIPKDTDIFSAQWKTVQGISVGCYFWSAQFFSRITYLSKQNMLTRLLSPSHTGDLKSLTLTSLRGTSYHQQFMRLEKGNKEIGQRIVYRAFMEKSDDFYIGVPLTNLLLSPQVIQDHEENLQRSLHTFRSVLQQRLRETYGSPRPKDVSLLHALPEKICAQLPNRLAQDLESFF